MINARTQVRFRDALPKSADVVVIGGGVIGVFASLYLRRLGKSVVLCEKGCVAGEQSSRNWGWVRCQNRDPAELPLAMEAQRLWKEVDAEVKGRTGFTQTGVLYACSSEESLAKWQFWLDIAAEHGLDSRLISAAEVDQRVVRHSSTQRYIGGLLTATDGRAEPWTAVPAVAELAQSEGVAIREQCAVRALDVQGGQVVGVVTEAGPVRASHVVLAGGAWSSMLLRNHGVDIPQLLVRGTVAATAEVPEVHAGNLKDEQLASRRRQDGGYTLALPNTHHFVGPDSFRHALKYARLLGTLPDVSLRPPSFAHPNSWTARRRWAADEPTPFEQTRVLDPPPDEPTVAKLRALFAERYPEVGRPTIRAAWGGMIDAMPDVVPIVDQMPTMAGLIVATGMSAHGFGIGPAFGKAVAHMAAGKPVAHDMHRFRATRFDDGTPIRPGPGL